MIELPTVPTRQAAAVEGRSKPLAVTGKLRTALEAMIWQGLNRTQAAKLAGLNDHSVRCALRKTHVLSFYHAELAALRTSLRARNTHVLAGITEESDNDAARVKAVQVLEGMSDQAMSGGFGARPRAGWAIDLTETEDAGVVIRINPGQRPDPDLIDVTPTRPVPFQPE
jgi:hypothetical protein